MLKRDFLKNSLLTAVGALLSPAVLAAAHEEKLLREARATPMADGPFTLPGPALRLRRPRTPHRRAHDGKFTTTPHHKGYVSKLNAAVMGTPAEKMSLADLLASMNKQPEAIRNNAGGHWNHSFFLADYGAQRRRPAHRQPRHGHQ